MTGIYDTGNPVNNQYSIITCVRNGVLYPDRLLEGEIRNLAQRYNSVPSHFFIFAVLLKIADREWPGGFLAAKTEVLLYGHAEKNSNEWYPPDRVPTLG